MLDPNYHNCPICKTDLEQNGARYSVDELFRLWEPIRFSKETIDEHRNQSEYTVMYSCPRCRLDIFLPQIIGSQKFYVEAYNLTGLQNGSRFTYVDSKWDFDEAIKDVKSFESIIEVGCGPGSFLVKAKPYVRQIIGIEYNEEALQIARSKGLHVLRVDDQDESLKGKFDGVFSFHVLEHVGDPLAFMEQICSFVKPGGKIGISVPNQDGPVKYINPCVMNMPPHHATRWTLKTFKELAQRMDLIIERVAYEPLLLENQNYYSLYWVHQRLSGQRLTNRLARFILSKMLELFLGALAKLGHKYFTWLKGQSIYVLMSKPYKLSQ